MKALPISTVTTANNDTRIISCLELDEEAELTDNELLPDVVEIVVCELTGVVLVVAFVSIEATELLEAVVISLSVCRVRVMESVGITVTLLSPKFVTYRS